MDEPTLDDPTLDDPTLEHRALTVTARAPAVEPAPIPDLQALQASDGETFAVLFDRYWTDVVGFVSRRTAHDEAVDLAVLLLAEWDDLAYAEIAELQQIPVGTARSRAHRARRQLRAALAGFEPSDDDERR